MIIYWILFFAGVGLKIVPLKNKTKLSIKTYKTAHRLQACNFHSVTCSEQLSLGHRWVVA